MTRRYGSASLRISPVWFAVLVLVTVLYPGVARLLVPNADRGGSYLIAGALAVLLLMSVLGHETGHVAACRLVGIAVHAVVLSVPDGSVEHDRPDTPLRLAAVASGGPAANFALGLLCAALSAISDGVPTALLGAAAAINLVVAGFTVLPGLPMDGGALLWAAVWAFSGSSEAGRRVACRTGRALAIVIAASALIPARVDDPVGSAAVLVAAWLVAAYVWHGAGPVGAKSVGGHAFRAWFGIGAMWVIGMLLVRVFMAQSMVVTSGSMEETLRSGDHIIVDKLSYRLSGPRHGDIVVLRRPPGAHVPETSLVKRVIGLPGDRLEERRGTVFRNGAALPEPYLHGGCADNAPGLTAVVVPDQQVYVLGDNRCDSLDSRSFGPVDQGLLQGRAIVVIWPLSRVGGIGR